MKLASAEKIRRYRAAGHWQDQTVFQMFETAAGEADGEALVDPLNRPALDGQEAQRLTWNQAAQGAARMAAALSANGIERDDIVLVQAPNIHELVLLYLACARLGAIISPVPVQYGAHELGNIIASVNPRAAVGACLADGARVPLMAIAQQHGIGTFWLNAPDSPATPSLRDHVDSGLLATVPHPSADDCFTLCWTSGTTGTPKGVPRSHNHWHAQGPAMYHGLSMGTGDRMLSPFPFVNMAAIGGSMMGWILGRGALILHHPFDLAVFLQQVVLERPNVTLLPPAVLNLLLKDPELSERVDFSAISAVGSGSAPLSPWMVEGWQMRGVNVVNVFGSNEGAALLSAPEDVPDPAQRATCFPRFGQIAGRWKNPISRTTETRLVEPASGDIVDTPGTVGELYIRGPNVFEGYWGMSEQETEALRLFDREGFFRTGDLFEISADDTTLMRFVARAKDIIIRGGMNISLEEVDSLLTDHPMLVEAATFPVADEILGERLGVAVVPKPGEPVSLEALTGHLRDKGLAVFKLPEFICTVATLPRNAMNKVLRHELAASAAMPTRGAAEQDR